ncbi:hypothetical protein PAEPH01_1806 [Pancytospora epiphaga]|nr:hypothetical protein PAEPH01_1806 [Pancytospora epiphaga]
MKIINFFDEEMEIEGNKSEKEIKEEITQKYGIPGEIQKISGPPSQPILRLENRSIVEDVIREIPVELLELGCSKERFNRYYTKYGKEAFTKLFPFLRLRLEKPDRYFGYIDKIGLEKQDEYVKRIRQEDKHTIVKDIKSYIRTFLRSSMNKTRRV